LIVILKLLWFAFYHPYFTWCAKSEKGETGLILKGWCEKGFTLGKGNQSKGRLTTELSEGGAGSRYSVKKGEGIFTTEITESTEIAHKQTIEGNMQQESDNRLRQPSISQFTLRIVLRAFHSPRPWGSPFGQSLRDCADSLSWGFVRCA